MEKTLFVMSLGFAGLILATQAGWAAPQCGPRDQVLATLADRFGETRRGIGLAGPEQVMELFASTASGTWSITVTLPDGTTCLVASGQAFETLAEDPAAPGAPA